LWACARLVSQQDNLQVAIAHELILRPNHFGSQDVSNLAWACTKLQWRDKQILEGLEAICMMKAMELQV